MQFYPSDHPRVTENVSEFTDLVHAFLDDHPRFVVAVDGDHLLIDDSPIDDNEVSVQLIEVLEKRKIGSVVFERGVSEKEISSFLELLTTSPDTLLDGEEIQDSYLDPLQKIEVDELEVQYSTASGPSSPIDTDNQADTNSEEETTSESDSSGDDDGEDSPFSSIETKSEALKNLLTSNPNPEMIYDWVSELMSELDLTDQPDQAEASIDALLSLINKSVNEAEEAGEDLPEEPIRQFLVQFTMKLGLMNGMDFSKIKKHLNSSLEQLDPSAAKLLTEGTDPGESADDLMEQTQPQARGLVLAREIHKGTTSMDQISRMMESIAPDGDDVVEVTAFAVEEISQFTNMSGKESSAGELASLFNGLLANSPYQNPSHQILVADNDEKYDQYLLYLSNLNYFFDLHEDGYEAWRSINADKDIDLIILEIKIPGKTGLELIEDLATLESPPPVIVCTKYPQFRDAYEIVTYPSVEFLEKPVEEERFIEAVQNLFPESAQDDKEKAPLYSEEEMERAHGIQNKLMNQPLPDIEGYEISRYHQSAPRIEGDFLDVIPINETRFLFTLAEVSGTGVTASLVMVILRSTLYVLQNQITEPREMLVQLNRFITNELNRSMYANILLGRLDLSDQTVQLASAGNSSITFWNQKSKNLSRINMNGISAGLTGNRRFNEYLETRNVAMNPGDAIVLHSEGVNNIRNKKGKKFGESRVQNLIQRSASESADNVTSEFAEEITSFRGNDPVEEDCSVLTIKSS